MRFATLLLALMLPMTLPSHAQTTPTGIVTLASLRDNARPLLIFAPTPDDPQLQIQIRRLNQGAAAVAERDIVVIAIPWNNPSPTAATLSSTDAEAARRRFHVAPAEFTVILLGKDGGEKLRSTRPLTVQRLNDTIDAMPMRQDEMRSRQTPPRPTPPS